MWHKTCDTWHKTHFFFLIFLFLDFGATFCTCQDIQCLLYAALFFISATSLIVINFPFPVLSGREFLTPQQRRPGEEERTILEQQSLQLLNFCQNLPWTSLNMSWFCFVSCSSLQLYSLGPGRDTERQTLLGQVQTCPNPVLSLNLWEIIEGCFRWRFLDLFLTSLISFLRCQTHCRVPPLELKPPLRRRQRLQENCPLVIVYWCSSMTKKLR